MARIAGEILIGRPVDVVFDFVADQRNEPRYNPRMLRAYKVTGGDPLPEGAPAALVAMDQPSGIAAQIGSAP